MNILPMSVSGRGIRDSATGQSGMVWTTRFDFVRERTSVYGALGRWGIVLLLLAGCTPATPTPPTSHLVQGTIALHDTDSSAANEFGYCTGQGGYADLQQGAQVTVKDQAGTIIATGALEPGQANDLENTCTFKFTLLSLPDAAFYSIEVARRGAISYSRAELEAQGWTVTLTLGD